MTPTQPTLPELTTLLANENRAEIHLQGVCFDGLDLERFDFHGVDLRGASFKGCNLTSVNFRHADLTGIQLQGANLFGAILEDAVVKDIADDAQTRFFRLYCPESGAFIGWKKCFNSRVVQLLIPADARRSSATYNTCRCDKAKVLSIKSPDYRQIYDEATSYVDEGFVYRTGAFVYASGFCEDRWNDSTEGIHFFMTRQEALGYL